MGASRLGVPATIRAWPPERDPQRSRRVHAPARRGALACCLAAFACARGEGAWQRELGDPHPFVRELAAIGLAFQAPQAAAPAGSGGPSTQAAGVASARGAS